MKQPCHLAWKDNLEIWLPYRWWSCVPLYAPHSDADVYLDETDGQRAQWWVVSGKQGGRGLLLPLSFWHERQRGIAAAEWYSTLVPSIRCIACSRMQPFAGPADPQLRPCPVLITTQQTQPLYTFKFFCSRKNSRCICKRFKRVLEQPLYWHMRRTGKNRYNMWQSPSSLRGKTCILWLKLLPQITPHYHQGLVTNLTRMKGKTQRIRGHTENLYLPMGWELGSWVGNLNWVK